MRLQEGRRIFGGWRVEGLLNAKGRRIEGGPDMKLAGTHSPPIKSPPLFVENLKASDSGNPPIIDWLWW